MSKKERTKLLAVLTGLTYVATGVLLALHHPMLVEWPVIAAVAVPWIGINVALRVKADTWGRELPVVDWWSVPHFGAGLLLGLFGIGSVIVLAFAVLWELVEIISRVEEYPTNRIADLVLAFCGWIVANLLASGPFAAL